MAFKQNTIAIVYDFDETLSPKAMQEYTILKTLGENSGDFWSECQREEQEYGADRMLTYMRLLVDKMKKLKISLTKKDWQELGENIEYFEGVEDFFERINHYVKNKFGNTIKIEHYIISAGLKEILDGITIKKHFKKIYASEYYFDDYSGNAEFPTVVVNSATKTQFLFEINKGVRAVNKHMDKKDRAIPFENMLYIGDGETDVPCMTIVKKNGGFSMAVHKPRISKKINECKSLLEANRIDYYAPADYREHKDLEQKVQLILDVIGSNILFQKEKFNMKEKFNKSKKNL
jgi:phosphoserine phosphatase